MRLFIAVPISEEARLALSQIQAALAARLPGWLWSKPENLHLTLAFLGETNPEKIPLIEDIIRRACASMPAFGIGFGGFGAFPAARDPRVIYLGCSRGEKELSALAQNLLPDLLSAGVLPDAEKGRAFRAHLTLARRMPNLARQKAAADLKLLIAAQPDFTAAASPADDVVLYESRPSVGGSEYRPLFRLGLDKQS